MPPWALLGRPVRVRFPFGGARRDVAHGLPITPDGFMVVWSDAPVYGAPGATWNANIASLVSPTTNANAIIIFYTLKEDATDA